ncbi:cyclase family protein [Actinomadura hibisca]|uniref:cyclase family protein n=1 Tax=Actinomadura hibisca TaxID=68565 RepID=UPI000830BEDF|nr:cyclase family protein [Actinomadura hibisca]
MNQQQASGAFVELNHVVRDGMRTAPNLPEPAVSPYLTREASREIYAPGTEFTIDRISMVGGTGTYLDAPFHRYPDGADLTGVPLERTVDLPAIVIDVRDAKDAIGVEILEKHDVRGAAVLLYTGDAERFDTPAYTAAPRFLTRAAASWLIEQNVVLVGIDAANVDDTGDGQRPAHTLLLGAGVPIVENLTGLDLLPKTGARFTAVPLRVAGFGSIPVRAFARLP